MGIIVRIEQASGTRSGRRRQVHENAIVRAVNQPSMDAHSWRCQVIVRIVHGRPVNQAAVVGLRRKQVRVRERFWAHRERVMNLGVLPRRVHANRISSDDMRDDWGRIDDLHVVDIMHFLPAQT